MKRYLAALFGAVFFVAACSLAQAEQTQRAYPEGGVTLTLPESLQGEKGVVFLEEGGSLMGDAYYVPLLYGAMTEEELQVIYADDATEEEQEAGWEQIELLAYYFVVPEDFTQEDILSLFGEGLVVDAALLKEAEGRALYVCFFPEMETDMEDFAEEYVEEYVSLRDHVQDVGESAELYEAKSKYDALQGTTVSFETVDTEGNPASSEELFGAYDMTLVNIFTSWCPYCIEEMGQLEELYQSLKERGGAVLGILYDGKEAAALETAKGILEDNGVSFPVLIVPDNAGDLFLVEAYPTTYFVDREGKIVGNPVVGAAFEEYVNRIEKYLGEASETEEAEAAEAEETGAAEAEAGEAEEEIPQAEANDAGVYRVFTVNEDGDPVSGAMVQFCSDTLCMMGQTDENGMAVFEQEEGHYTAHLLAAPEGYAPDETEYTLLDTYSDLTIVLKKQ